MYLVIGKTVVHSAVLRRFYLGVHVTYLEYSFQNI